MQSQSHDSDTQIMRRRSPESDVSVHRVPFLRRVRSVQSGVNGEIFRLLPTPYAHVHRKARLTKFWMPEKISQTIDLLKA